MVRSVLLHNRNGASFVDVTTSSGTGEMHKGHGVAFADSTTTATKTSSSRWAARRQATRMRFGCSRTRATDTTGSIVELVGVTTNRAGIGARVSVTVEYPDGGRRTFHRAIGSGGSFGASPLQQHIGIGASARIRGDRHLVAGEQHPPAVCERPEEPDD